MSLSVARNSNVNQMLTPIHQLCCFANPILLSGVEVRVTPMRTEIIIRATRTQNVLGEKGRRIRELTSLVQKRFLLGN